MSPQLVGASDADSCHDDFLQARNLLKAGYSVTVWNRSPEKCKDLEGEGASVAFSSADCVAASDITIAMLADPPAALAVAHDAVKGLTKGEHEHALHDIVQCSALLAFCS